MPRSTVAHSQKRASFTSGYYLVSRANSGSSSVRACDFETLTVQVPRPNFSSTPLIGILYPLVLCGVLFCIGLGRSV